MLLSTSAGGQVCYLETANLDGESDLKIRLAVSSTDTQGGEARAPKGARMVEVEVPFRAGRELSGLVRVGASVSPLSEQQALLQGSQVMTKLGLWA